MNDKGNIQSALSFAKGINGEIQTLLPPPEETGEPINDYIIPLKLFKKKRGYIIKTINQINGTYEKGYYDACAVMIRRLIETLIIEVYEYNNISEEIKDNNGDFLFLSGLIPKINNEKNCNISRTAKVTLDKIKKLGDSSAHNRRFNAHKRDIDSLKLDLRILIEELLTLSGLN